MDGIVYRRQNVVQYIPCWSTQTKYHISPIFWPFRQMGQSNVKSTMQHAGIGSWKAGRPHRENKLPKRWWLNVDHSQSIGQYLLYLFTPCIWSLGVIPQWSKSFPGSAWLLQKNRWTVICVYSRSESSVRHAYTTFYIRPTIQSLCAAPARWRLLVFESWEYTLAWNTNDQRNSNVHAP